MGVSKLFKQFSKMTEEEKADFMELISNDDEEVKEDKEVKQVVEETQTQKENNKEVEAKAKTQPKEEKEDSEVVENKTDEAIVENEPKAEAQNGAEVKEVEAFDGISINDVALKTDVDAKIDALNAKLEAIVKENQDLKDKLSEAENKANDLHNKYEKEDFGSQVDKNYGEKDFGKSYESADDYLKKFV